VRFRVSEPATVSLRIERRTRHGWRDTARGVTRRRGAGRGSLRFTTRGLRRGRYRVSVRAQDAARNRSRRTTRRFRVIRG
jgi:hypothetical protein